MCVLFVRNSSRLSPGAAPGVSVAMRSFALPRETSGAANEEKEKPAFTSNFTVFSERERCCPGRGPEGRAGRGERCPGGRSTNGTLRRLAPGRRGQGDRRALQAGKGPGHRSPGDALPSTTPPAPVPPSRAVPPPPARSRCPAPRPHVPAGTAADRAGRPCALPPGSRLPPRTARGLGPRSRRRQLPGPDRAGPGRGWRRAGGSLASTGGAGVLLARQARWPSGKASVS